MSGLMHMITWASHSIPSCVHVCQIQFSTKHATLSWNVSVLNGAYLNFIGCCLNPGWGPWTIKLMKAESELISKYILIHADLFSSWGLLSLTVGFNTGLPSVITKDSMVGHNYIMQMTFAVLFELIPSDVSFFYHTPHTSVSPHGSTSSSFSGPQVASTVCPDCHADTACCDDPAGVTCACDTGYADSWSEQVYTDSTSNGNTHLAPTQRTGMKNLFSSHFFGDWLTVLWHSALWL